jgi:hypothetical protein
MFFLMQSIAFEVGFWTPTVLIVVAVYFTFRFMRGLYRKVTRS